MIKAHLILGGTNGMGTVLDVENWDYCSFNCMVSVKWQNSSVNRYRMGYKGKVDLKYTAPKNDLFYYSTHLPKAGNKFHMYYISTFLVNCLNQTSF